VDSLAITDNFCDSNFPKLLKGFIFLYVAFIIKAIVHASLILANTQNAESSKISMTTFDYILNL
jgi:hypothetical protein